MQVLTSTDGRLTVLSLQAALGDMWELWDPHGCPTSTLTTSKEAQRGVAFKCKECTCKETCV